MKKVGIVEYWNIGCQNVTVPHSFTSRPIPAFHPSNIPYADRFGDRAGEFKIVAVFRAVGIHTGEQNFARAALLSPFNCPLNCV
jgi:hypothetical protein